MRNVTALQWRKKRHYFQSSLVAPTVCAAAIAMVAPIIAKHNNMDFIADVSEELLRLRLSGNRRNSDSHLSEKWP
jgi:hypothetical protein